MFFKRAEIHQSQIEAQKATAELQIEISNKVGYQVYNVGDKDFAAGIDFVKKLEDQADYDFISANIKYQDKDELVFKPYKIIKSGSNKFGVVGITSIPKKPIPGVKITDPAEALNSVLKMIEPKTDYILLLAATNTTDENNLFGIEGPLEIQPDIICFGRTYRFSRSLNYTNNSYKALCGNGGKYLGLITAELTDKSMPLRDISKTKYNLNFVEKRLAAYRKNAGDQVLEEYYSEKKNILNVIKSLKNQKVKYESELEKLINPLDYSLVELDKEIPDDKEVLKAVNEHKAYLKESGLIKTITKKSVRTKKNN